jgi:spermidine synthase
VVALFVFTPAFAALLLFVAQPMFARMILPAFGGTPSVWTTCVVFYQGILLAGYLYAHLATRWLGARRQAAVHLAAALLPWLVLPLAVPEGWAPATDDDPAIALLGLLAAATGLPMFIVSATAPLLQQWLSATGLRAAADPYFLYAASNAGSLLALLAYPAVIEPSVGLRLQSQLWAIGYGILVIAIGACAASLWRAAPPADRAATAAGTAEGASPPGSRRFLEWLLLALVPSSLLLSVTTHITTDIAAIPILWVIPLAVYLSTYVLTFLRRPPVPHRLPVLALPVVVIPPVFSILADANRPAWVWIPLHLAALAVVGLVCHGELARRRPPSSHLTAFNLCVALGGAIGGLLSAVVAPVVFQTAAEYPLALLAACLLRPPLDPGHPGERWSLATVAWPLGLGLATLGLALASRAASLPVGSFASLLVVFGAPMLIWALWWPRRIRFALTLGALAAAGTIYARSDGRLLFVERDFFGIQRVIVDPDGRYRMLLHGSTIHGIQAIDAGRRRETLSYFSSGGPIGQVFDTVLTPRADARIAVLGLGTGTLACYGSVGQQWTFFEINPGMERLARDDRYFTFLRDCLPRSTIILGDARLALARHGGRDYDAIVFDAFSSDALPVHLLTREALELYVERLAPDGVLAFNISNRYVDLEPVLAALARDAGLSGVARSDRELSPQDWDAGTFPSDWVVMARASGSIAPLTADRRWRPLTAPAGGPVWTDQYSNVVATFKWRRRPPS